MQEVRWGGAELLLLKSKQYENQAEYRMMWELDSLSGDFLDIFAPNARQYCRKVRSEEY